MELKDIRPELLDLVMRDHDYVIYYGESPAKTSNGNELAHINPRILKQILLDFSLGFGVDSTLVNAFSLFSYQKDIIEYDQDPVLKHFDSIVDIDAFVQLKMGKKKQSQVFSPEVFETIISQNPLFFNLVFWGVSGVLDTLNNTLAKENDQDIKASKPSNHNWMEHLLETYSNFSNAEKAVVNVLCFAHEAGIVLPLLLVSKYINASEYVNGVFAVHLNRPQEYTGHSFLHQFLDTPLSIESRSLKTSALKGSFWEFYNDARRASEYLVCFDESKPGGVKKYIDRGESNDLEFKATLRWDLKQGKTNQAVERASLKTISAFLNSGGGVLLIGVRDDGSIEGIESDRFPNEDKFLLHFWTLIRTCFGRDISPFVQTSLEPTDGKKVCMVRCFRSPSPVFLRQPGFEEEFYIRVGPSSAALAVSEALKYIANHFSEQ